jgi:hypothetical protein
MWYHIWNEELGCFKGCQRKVFRLFDVAQITDTAAVYKIEMIAKAMSCGVFIGFELSTSIWQRGDLSFVVVRNERETVSDKKGITTQPQLT